MKLLEKTDLGPGLNSIPHTADSSIVNQRKGPRVRGKTAQSDTPLNNANQLAGLYKAVDFPE